VGEVCGLTFELTGPLRQGGLARMQKMYRVPAAGPSWPAVAGPVERRVRPHPWVQPELWVLEQQRRWLLRRLERLAGG
jgi:hypothetical protein